MKKSLQKSNQQLHLPKILIERKNKNKKIHIDNEIVGS